MAATLADRLMRAGQERIAVGLFSAHAGRCLAADGEYMRPVETRFGRCAPSVKKSLEALSEHGGETIVPNGGGAANWLGLTTQNPVRSVYLTSGRNRRLHFGKHVPGSRNGSGRRLSSATSNTIRCSRRSEPFARKSSRLRSTFHRRAPCCPRGRVRCRIAPSQHRVSRCPSSGNARGAHLLGEGNRGARLLPSGTPQGWALVQALARPRSPRRRRDRGTGCGGL